MSERRNFLKAMASAMVGGGALLAYRSGGSMKAQGPPSCTFFPFPPLPPSPGMFPFVDRLPIPRVLRAVGVAPNPHGTARVSPYYEVAMTQVSQKLHRDLPPTPVWASSRVVGAFRSTAPAVSPWPTTDRDTTPSPSHRHSRRIAFQKRVSKRSPQSVTL